MEPHDDYRNGDGSGSGSGSDSDGAEGEAGRPGRLVLRDAAAPARALRALNALRKSRQHYDVLLRAAPAGPDVPAHRAVLAAHAPYLLRALAAPAAAAEPAVYRVAGVEPEALRALVEYAYTGRLAARPGAAARALYRAAWRLRLEGAAAALAERLARRPRPHDALELRALPDLPPPLLHELDAYIAHNFDDICASGALAALPLVRVELVAGGEAGAGAPLAVAEAALAFLRDHHADTAVEEVCARAHLVYVDEEGALRDCGELPPARGDAPELREYRRAAELRRAQPPPAAPRAPAPPPAPELGARAPRPDTAVLAARGADANGGGRRVTRALLALRGRLVAARISSSAAGAAGADAADAGGAGRERARLAGGRCAAGAAALGGRLLVCGGYDRARALRSAAAYEPAADAWAPLPDMRSARARFPAVCLDGAVYALGGSDGQNELDSVDVYEERQAAGGAAVGLWAARGRMPLARSHAAAAAGGGALFVLGGWAGGRCLAHVARYEPGAGPGGAWRAEPPLAAPRSQCAAALWRGALWALGGCDAWHCLASTERLPLAAPAAAWQPGPPLPAARRSAGAAVWRGRLVLVGGSDGAASLRRTDWLPPPPGAPDSPDGPDGPDGPDAPAELAWRPGPALRRARAALGLAVVQDVLYAVGGFDGKEFLSCVECLYAPEGEWTSLCAAPAPRAPPAAPTPQRQGAEGGEPAAEGGPPGAEGGKPGAEGGPPVAEGGPPVAEGGPPVAEGGKPGAEGGPPGAEGGPPVAEGGKPGAEGGPPGAALPGGAAQ